MLLRGAGDCAVAARVAPRADASVVTDTTVGLPAEPEAGTGTGIDGGPPTTVGHPAQGDRSPAEAGTAERPRQAS